MIAPLMMAKIEILDRVAIIVGEGVVLESQVKGMMQNIKKRYSEPVSYTHLTLPTKA